ncbi:hypothetical protein [Luteolibacter marinus]|uniref:hypothetical protein n=1 Tax=Luteolibacter marinus TaxID=2776705 RepID=UPI001866EB99|nr:hypothetical protein [Luteolibacter marinus]
MKPGHLPQDVEELLRSRKPDPRPSPGLERKIIEALEHRGLRSRFRIRAWHILPPAIAASILLVWPERHPSHGKPSQQAQMAPGSEVTSTTPPESTADSLNPLERESKALQRDARRTGRFLIDCLPSFSMTTR